MGDDATVQAKPRLSPAVGDLGDHDKKVPASSVAASRCPRTRGDAHTPPGTALERKKSYHPELRPASDADALVSGLGHKMELIHLNRTCTSVDLSVSTASSSPSRGLASSLRRASDANLTDEEKVHRVRHQVSFAQDVGVDCSGARSLRSEDLVSALKSRVIAAHLEDSLPEDLPEDSDQDEEGPESDTPDNNSCQEDDDQDDVPYEFLDTAVNLSPDNDADYLAVRPSLASTQLNEVRGPN
ncbi:uncharacterized protein LOC113207149 [Frankliniella occidentalis]|uniref:Uncharacterized protein LOC113207149 n=1 Tax=Frankliniella occidentalis TaxID=133901 RepID=A0A6J1SEA1_FRAOC|nr:uncharacterized protein LOC113207149 [Frankliniella occidentalis]XP_052132859.1 uncharacterized protein LOC113207149 [Frankliniella occidentalis]XP_052132860.1 uncharacterized protein LOC113207149 [Frankliniella occidentalis]